MFKRDVKNISDLIMTNLRSLGLETPLLQRRLIESWPEVAGPLIAQSTRVEFILTQASMVKLNNICLAFLPFVIITFFPFIEGGLYHRVVLVYIFKICLLVEDIIDDSTVYEFFELMI